MRIPALFFSLALGLLASSAQAQNPGAQQDAEAAREKLLKAADQLDNIQANSETTRTSVEGMKTDVTSLQQSVTKLEGDNAALKQQLTDLQAAFEQYKAEQVKTQQALIDNVADMMAKGSGKTPKKKKPIADTTDATPPETSTEVHSSTPATAPTLAPPPDNSASTAATPPPAPKPAKGYFHTVAEGETVSMIAEAYRDNGVKVTASQIRKANGLTTDSKLKTGQKLFIPKPGT